MDLNFSHLADDDDFNWNYGIALAAAGEHIEAENRLLKAQNDLYRQELSYCTWLARCYIKNKKAELAWNLYSSIDEENRIHFLKVIGGDSFRAKSFLIAARSFHKLSNLDIDVDYSQGIKSACVGIFRNVVCENYIKNALSEAAKNSLREAIDILQDIDVEAHNDLKQILITLKNWMKRNIAKESRT